MKAEYQIQTLDALRAIIPNPPKIMAKRIQTSLERFCLEFIEHACFAVLSYSGAHEGIECFALSAGSLEGSSSHTLRLRCENPTSDQEGKVCVLGSVYFFVRGARHGLRVNGRVTFEQDTILISIRDAYFHCARAKARSEFWGEQASNVQPQSGECEQGPQLGLYSQAFVKRSPYLLLRTENAQGETEISPRGDMGTVAGILNRQRLILPERPGNKVATSLSNILECDTVGMTFFVPGDQRVLHVSGKASLTCDPALLQPFAVNNKVPIIGIVLQVTHAVLARNQALAKANLWEYGSDQDASGVTSFATVMSRHLNGEGVLGALSRPIVSAAIKHEMKHLY